MESRVKYMEAFRHNMRIVVTEPDHPLRDFTGIVRNTVHGNKGAWVELDSDIPEHMRMLPEGNEQRNRFYCFCTESCEEVEAQNVPV